MNRTEKRIFRLGDEIAGLSEELRLAREELVFHQHLNDDAQRDAAGGSPLDKADARETAQDVARIEAHIARLEDRIARAEAKRTALVAKLD